MDVLFSSYFQSYFELCFALTTSSILLVLMKSGPTDISPVEQASLLNRFIDVFIVVSYTACCCDLFAMVMYYFRVYSEFK